MSDGRIHILDEIDFEPGERASFLAALEKRYRPEAESIGLRLRSLWLDPAVDVAGIPSRAVLDWELGLVGDFWAWRQRGGAHPALAAFWIDASPQIARRVRRYVRDVALLEPEAFERSGLAAGSARPTAGSATAGSGGAQPVPGLRRTVAFVSLRSGASEQERASLERALEAEAERAPEVAASSLGRNLPGSQGGGDYTFDLASGSGASADSGAAAPSASALALRLPNSLRALLAKQDELELEPIAGGLRQPGIAGAIKRTLFLRVYAEAAPAAVAEFERALLAMPAHIGAIRNWCLSRVRAGSSKQGWTHVWEQDFAELSGLAEDYMNDPIHWSVVDGWFHAEDPRCIVAPRLAHVFCHAKRSVLSHALAPVARG